MPGSRHWGSESGKKAFMCILLCSLIIVLTMTDYKNVKITLKKRRGGEANWQVGGKMEGRGRGEGR